MRTNALKVEDSQAVLDGIINVITKTQDDSTSSPTVEFKLSLFQNYTISRNEIMKLIARPNTFLHNTLVISVVDGGDGDEIFSAENTRN